MTLCLLCVSRMAVNFFHVRPVARLSAKNIQKYDLFITGGRVKNNANNDAEHNLDLSKDLNIIVKDEGSCNFFSSPTCCHYSLRIQHCSFIDITSFDATYEVKWKDIHLTSSTQS